MGKPFNITVRGLVFSFFCVFVQQALAIEEAKDVDAPQVSTEPNNADHYFHLAQKYFAKKDEEKGLSALKQAIALNPENDQYYYELSRYYAENNMPIKAFAAIDKAAKLNPNKIEYWRNRGIIANWLKKTDEMEESYSSALKINPNDKDSITGLKQAREQKHYLADLAKEQKKPKPKPKPKHHKKKHALKKWKKYSTINPEHFYPFITLGAQNFSDTHTVNITDVGITGYEPITNRFALHYAVLYEYATATNLAYTPINGGQVITDASGTLGLFYHIDSCVNAEVNGGVMTIEDTGEFGIYNATVRAFAAPRVWASYRFSHNLFRPDYVVVASPRSISLSIMENNNIVQLHGEFQDRKFLDIRAEYNSLSDHNDLRHVTAVPSARILTTQHVLLNLGLYTDVYSFVRRYPNDGYYSPVLAQVYFAMANFYYGLNEFSGLSVTVAAGPEKDETFDHFYLGTDLSVSTILRLSQHCELNIFGGYSIRGAPIDNYEAWSGRIALTHYF